MDIIELCKRHVSERLSDGKTHYEGCEQEHVICALEKLIELTEHLLAELLAADAKADRQLASCREDVEKLRQQLGGMVRDGGEEQADAG